MILEPYYPKWYEFRETQDGAREQRQSPFDPMQEGRGRLRFDRFADGPATDVVLLKATYLWH